MNVLESSAFAHARLARSVCILAERHGIALTDLLAGAGLTPTMLEERAHALDFGLLRKLSERLVHAVGPAVAVEFGVMSSVRELGFIGYAALSSSTLGEALQLLARYHRTYCPFTVTFRVEGRDAVLEVSEREPWGGILPIAIESTVVRFAKIVQELSRDLGPAEVRLAAAPRPHHAVLPEVVRAPVQAGCGSNQLRFAAKATEQRLPTADPVLQRLSAAQCDRDRTHVAGEETLLERLEREIGAQGDWDLSMGRVARSLGMTERTLRRRLAELGPGYQDIVDKLRRKVALDLLSTTRDSIDALAERLGYADVAGFRRAVRRWTGVSPAEYRSARRAAR